MARRCYTFEKYVKDVSILAVRRIETIIEPNKEKGYKYKDIYYEAVPGLEDLNVRSRVVEILHSKGYKVLFGLMDDYVSVNW